MEYSTDTSAGVLSFSRTRRGRVLGATLPVTPMKDFHWCFNALERFYMASDMCKSTRRQYSKSFNVKTRLSIYVHNEKHKRSSRLTRTVELALWLVRSIKIKEMDIDRRIGIPSIVGTAA